MIARLLCWLGLHSWDWSERKAGYSHYVVRCRRCGAQKLISENEPT